MKKILPILLALTILLSACTPQGTPTTAPADVQNTAVAAAWTMVALTQIAMPTATPLPPTETPAPTSLPTFPPEPLVIPTLEPLILPTATSSSSEDNCLHPLDMKAAGRTNPMRIENQSGGVIQWLSLNLATNAFGQCGALSYNNIPIGGKQVIELPIGTWYAYAGVNYKNGTSSTPYGVFVIRPGDYDLLRIIVKKDTIGAIP